MKEIHFICTVEDSINDNDVICEIWCSATTFNEAEAFFRKNDFIKKYIGNNRYRIYFKANARFIQGIA